MNKQEIFNKVASHLLKQNAKSEIFKESLNKTVCAYRGENGLKCGIGILIPDEKYNPSLECNTVNNTNVLEALEDGIDIYEEEMPTFLCRLQDIHDYNDTKNWKSSLKYFACQEGLNYDILNK
jgi:hypothetical protein